MIEKKKTDLERYEEQTMILAIRDGYVTTPQISKEVYIYQNTVISSLVRKGKLRKGEKIGKVFKYCLVEKQIEFVYETL